MLGDGELPSYEEPPCQECPPVPDYCSTGQTVLDQCGCVRSVLKVRVTSVVVSSACMVPVLTPSSVWRTPR